MTLARRWERLRDGGAAWVTAYPHVPGLYQVQAAYVEIRCASGQVRELIRELSTWPSVASIEEASREYSLVLTVFGLGLRDLSALLLDAIPSLPGVLNTRSHLASRLHVEGSSWRVGALDRRRVQALSQLPSIGGGRLAKLQPWEEPYAPLTVALGEDGRRSAADLARITGRPVSTVRRQLGHLLNADALTFRCEIAQGLTPSPIVVNWWCQVPVAHVSTCVDRLRANPTVRQMASLPGPANLLVTTWMRSIEESMRMQEHLEQGSGAAGGGGLGADPADGQADGVAAGRFGAEQGVCGDYACSGPGGNALAPHQVNRNVARYSDGETPSASRKCRRRVAALPIPQLAAIWPTEESVRSRSSCARASRC